MNRIRFLIALTAAVLLCGEARADFYFEQEVRATQKGLDGAQDEKGVSDYRRKVYVLGQVLAVQVEERGQLQKEYGFDFEKNLYYEADPVAGRYKWFDLNLLGAAFERMGKEARSSRNSRQQGAADFARALVEGKLDYPVRIQKAPFGKKQYGGREARLYKLRAGPGSAFLNFFGWYRKADIWASKDLPGFSEYEPLRARLSRKAAFYKIKHNRVSDFITTLAALEGVPLQIDSVARRRFERATAVETTREVTTAVRTAKIKKEQLLYFKKDRSFSWNAVFSKGTEFGPDVSLEHGESFSWRRALPWLVTPGFFLLFTCVWFLGPFPDKDRLALDRSVVLHIYTLSAFLFAAQVVHYLSDIPYLFSPVRELSLVAAVGFGVILWQARSHQSSVERQMREAHLRYCPHCHARCEQFYVVCPKCNRAIMPAEKTHGTQLPPE